jgi:SAM-dependent methyltransferase
MKKPWLKNTEPSKFIFDFVEKYAVGKKVLDVGSAQGWYIKYLKDIGFEVVASDIEKTLAFDDVPFVQTVGANLPFDDESFDTVLAINVIEHIDDEKKILSELQRVTRKRLLLSVPNSEDDLLQKYNLTFRHQTDKSHRREYSQKDIQKKLEAVGFEVKKIVLDGPVIPTVFAEFLPMNFLKTLGRKIINWLFTAGVLKNPQLQADIFVVADKNGRH